jgi:hypothetical protein
MAYALVTHLEAVPGANGGTSAAADTTGADLLVIHVASFAAASGVSDSKGNTWTALTEHSVGSRFSRFWYAKNATVGTGHTFTVSGTGIYPHLAVAAFSGSNTTAPADQQNGATGSGVTSLATGSVTPAEDNELVVAGLCGFDPVTPTINSSFTATDTEPSAGGSNMTGGLAYKVQTTATAVNPTWSWNASDSAAVSIASFKAGGGDTTPPTLSGAATNTGGTSITATLSESGCTNAAGGSSGTGGFTLAGTTATVSSWAISGTTLTLTLSGAVTNGQTVTYSYARASTTDDIKDAAGNFLADFSGAAVTNNVPPPLDVTIRVVQIADSLDANTPTSGEKPAAHFARIARTVRGHTANVTVVNGAVSGAKVADWVSGSTYLTNAKAAAVAQFGTPNRSTNPVYAHVRLYANDALVNTSTSSYLTDLTSLVNDLVTAGYYVVIRGETSGTGTYGGAVNTRQTTLRQQADTLINGTTILTGERVLKTLIEADPTLLGDDVHPSASGAEVWAACDADRQAAILYPSTAGGGARCIGG